MSEQYANDGKIAGMSPTKLDVPVPTPAPLTDQQALEELLARFGVTARSADGEVKLVAGVGKVEGYRGFNARFRFNAAGKFTDVGIWE